MRISDWSSDVCSSDLILFASNARAPFFLAQAAAPHLAAARGAIVNMTDIHAQRPPRDHAVYCMAKAAPEMATQSQAPELAPTVRVTALPPGAIPWAEDGPGVESPAAHPPRTPHPRRTPQGARGTRRYAR